MFFDGSINYPLATKAVVTKLFSFKKQFIVSIYSKEPKIVLNIVA